jgi:hypothetical protein
MPSAADSPSAVCKHAMSREFVSALQYLYGVPEGLNAYELNLAISTETRRGEFCEECWLNKQTKRVKARRTNINI